MSPSSILRYLFKSGMSPTFAAGIRLTSKNCRIENQHFSFLSGSVVLQILQGTILFLAQTVVHSQGVGRVQCEISNGTAMKGQVTTTSGELINIFENATTQTVQSYVVGPKEPSIASLLPALAHADLCDRHSCISSQEFVHTCPNGLNYSAPLIAQRLQDLAQEYLAKDPIAIDDVAIHVRCGDILKYRMREYGLSPYWVYQDLIAGRNISNVRSTGIVASPTTGCIRVKDCESLSSFAGRPAIVSSDYFS